MTEGEPAQGEVRVGSELKVTALLGVPTVAPGDDLEALIADALAHSELALADGDVIVVASKIVSRAEGCFIDLSATEPSERAKALADEVGKDPRLVEIILQESQAVSRKTEGALIVRHRLGFISANAGIDSSNAAPPDAPAESGPWVLTLPRDPDATAAQLKQALSERFDAKIGVIVTDSWGRPFRRGTVGFAVGVSGVPPLFDRRGAFDRHGRELQATESAVADSIAAAADLVAGQADESQPVTLVRGLRFDSTDEPARTLLRDPEQDLYA